MSIADSHHFRNYQISEASLENTALSCLRELGFGIIHGPEIAPREHAAERESFGEAILQRRLKGAPGSRAIRYPCANGLFRGRYGPYLRISIRHVRGALR